MVLNRKWVKFKSEKTGKFHLFIFISNYYSRQYKLFDFMYLLKNVNRNKIINKNKIYKMK